MIGFWLGRFFYQMKSGNIQQKTQLEAERRYGGIQPVCSTFFLHSEGVHAITFLKALLKLTVLL